MTDTIAMSPLRPYLLRAHYNWLLDNELTPHLVVDITAADVNVPMEYARDGQIVLNIAPRAVGNLDISNESVQFNARFGGVPRHVFVPMTAIIAVYARENGAGVMFEPEVAYEADLLMQSEAESNNPADNLVLVSDTESLHNIDKNDGLSPDDEPPKPPKPPKGRPALRVIK